MTGLVSNRMSTKRIFKNSCSNYILLVLIFVNTILNVFFKETGSRFVIYQITMNKVKKHSKATSKENTSLHMAIAPSIIQMWSDATCPVETVLPINYEK